MGVIGAALERFVGEVESRLARKDWDALSAMARFPLLVSSAEVGGGPLVRVRVADREEFLRRAPGLLASAGERSPVGSVWPAMSCRTAQVGMAGGMLWATAFGDGLAITSVSCRGCAGAEERQAVEFDCLAEGRRHVLRRIGGARWLEVSNPSAPAAAVAMGQLVEAGEGTGACSHLVWSGVVGGRRLVVREAAGCLEEAPAPGTVAFVGVEGAGSSEVGCVGAPRRP